MNEHMSLETDEECDELISSIHLSPIATVITDPRQQDNPIIAANDAFAQLTGYAPTEIVGKNCRFLGGPETEADKNALLRNAIERKEAVVTELTNYRKDGSTFFNAIMIAPIADPSGQPILYIGSQMAVNHPVSAESTRYDQAEKLVSQLSRRQKQVLALMANGLRNREIAEKLGIAEKTVKLHRSLALRNLDAQTSGDAIRIAVEAGLTSIR